MILFVGEQDKGYFVPEVAEKRKDTCEFTGFVGSQEELRDKILKSQCSYVILHLPTMFVLDYKSITPFLKNLQIANNKIKIICMAEGYNINSQIVQGSLAAGVEYFMLGTNASKLKAELTDALDGKSNVEELFGQIPTEEMRESAKEEITTNYTAPKTIAVAGCMRRIGTTTQAIQICKHILLSGHTACYIEMNHSGYIESFRDFYNEIACDIERGKLTYQNVDMFYNPDKIADILGAGYDYYVYDFGDMLNPQTFNLVQFLEKDVKILVCGSKVNEFIRIPSCFELIDKAKINYIFSFSPESDISDIKEMMQDRDISTYFAGYTPDPFIFLPDNKDNYNRILNLKQVALPEKKKRFSFFGRKKDNSDGKQV